MKAYRNLARTLLGVVLATICPSLMNAQENFDFWWTERRAKENAEQMELRTQQMLDTRRDRLQTLPLKDLFDEQNGGVWWFDGQHFYSLGYDGDRDQFRVVAPFDESLPLRHTFVPKKGKNGLSVTVKGHAGWTVAYQTVGPWRMIVVRDAQRRAVDCLLRVDQHYFMDRPDVQTLSMHDLFDGVYEGPEGKKAVFGPRLSHYEDIDYSKDPGIFSVVPDKQFNVTGHIMYGDNRVSRGDPSSPKFGKMPGGGGAAAIMGPMEWEVSPILGGLHVKVVKDEPFVLHSPDFGGKEFDLRRIASPYPDLPGIYAVASVRPLPLGLLRMLPKGDLQRMNSEIAERHTDRHDLSDIEQLNLELIKAALSAD